MPFRGLKLGKHKSGGQPAERASSTTDAPPKAAAERTGSQLGANAEARPASSGVKESAATTEASAAPTSATKPVTEAPTPSTLASAPSATDTTTSTNLSHSHSRSQSLDLRRRLRMPSTMSLGGKQKHGFGFRRVRTGTDTPAGASTSTLDLTNDAATPPVPPVPSTPKSLKESAKPEQVDLVVVPRPTEMSKPPMTPQTQSKGKGKAREEPTPPVPGPAKTTMFAGAARSPSASSSNTRSPARGISSTKGAGVPSPQHQNVTAKLASASTGQPGEVILLPPRMPKPRPTAAATAPTTPKRDVPAKMSPIVVPAATAKTPSTTTGAGLVASPSLVGAKPYMLPSSTSAAMTSSMTSSVSAPVPMPSTPNTSGLAPSISGAGLNLPVHSYLSPRKSNMTSLPATPRAYELPPSDSLPYLVSPDQSREISAANTSSTSIVDRSTHSPHVPTPTRAQKEGWILDDDDEEESEVDEAHQLVADERDLASLSDEQDADELASMDGTYASHAPTVMYDAEEFLDDGASTALGHRPTAAASSLGGHRGMPGSVPSDFGHERSTPLAPAAQIAPTTTAERDVKVRPLSTHAPMQSWLSPSDDASFKVKKLVDTKAPARPIVKLQRASSSASTATTSSAHSAVAPESMPAEKTLPAKTTTPTKTDTAKEHEEGPEHKSLLSSIGAMFHHHKGESESHASSSPPRQDRALPASPKDGTSVPPQGTEPGIVIETPPLPPRMRPRQPSNDSTAKAEETSTLPKPAPPISTLSEPVPISSVQGTPVTASTPTMSMPVAPVALPTSSNPTQSPDVVVPDTAAVVATASPSEPPAPETRSPLVSTTPTRPVAANTTTPSSSSERAPTHSTTEAPVPQSVALVDPVVSPTRPKPTATETTTPAQAETDTVTSPTDVVQTTMPADVSTKAPMTEDVATSKATTTDDVVSSKADASAKDVVSSKEDSATPGLTAETAPTPTRDVASTEEAAAPSASKDASTKVLATTEDAPAEVAPTAQAPTSTVDEATTPTSVPELAWSVHPDASVRPVTPPGSKAATTTTTTTTTTTEASSTHQPTVTETVAAAAGASVSGLMTGLSKLWHHSEDTPKDGTSSVLPSFLANHTPSYLPFHSSSTDATPASPARAPPPTTTEAPTSPPLPPLPTSPTPQKPGPSRAAMRSLADESPSKGGPAEALPVDKVAMPSPALTSNWIQTSPAVPVDDVPMPVPEVREVPTPISAPAPASSSDSHARDAPAPTHEDDEAEVLSPVSQYDDEDEEEEQPSRRYATEDYQSRYLQTVPEEEHGDATLMNSHNPMADISQDPSMLQSETLSTESEMPTAAPALRGTGVYDPETLTQFLRAMDEDDYGRAVYRASSMGVPLDVIPSNQPTATAAAAPVAPVEPPHPRPSELFAGKGVRWDSPDWLRSQIHGSRAQKSEAPAAHDFHTFLKQRRQLVPAFVWRDAETGEEVHSPQAPHQESDKFQDASTTVPTEASVPSAPTTPGRPASPEPGQSTPGGGAMPPSTSRGSLGSAHSSDVRMSRLLSQDSYWLEDSAPIEASLLSLDQLEKSYQGKHSTSAMPRREPLLRQPKPSVRETPAASKTPASTAPPPDVPPKADEYAQVQERRANDFRTSMSQPPYVTIQAPPRHAVDPSEFDQHLEQARQKQAAQYEEYARQHPTTKLATVPAPAQPQPPSQPVQPPSEPAPPPAQPTPPTSNSALSPVIGPKGVPLKPLKVRPESYVPYDEFGGGRPLYEIEEERQKQASSSANATADSAVATEYEKQQQEYEQKMQEYHAKQREYERQLQEYNEQQREYERQLREYEKQMQEYEQQQAQQQAQHAQPLPSQNARSSSQAMYEAPKGSQAYDTHDPHAYAYEPHSPQPGYEAYAQQGYDPAAYNYGSYEYQQQQASYAQPSSHDAYAQQSYDAYAQQGYQQQPNSYDAAYQHYDAYAQGAYSGADQAAYPPAPAPAPPQPHQPPQEYAYQPQPASSHSPSRRPKVAHAVSTTPLAKMNIPPAHHFNDVPFAPKMQQGGSTRPRRPDGSPASTAMTPKPSRRRHGGGTPSASYAQTLAPASPPTLSVPRAPRSPASMPDTSRSPMRSASYQKSERSHRRGGSGARSGWAALLRNDPMSAAR